MKTQNLFYALCVCVLSSIAMSSCRQETLMENGHEYVDLGLSAKWATCNVGASSPQEYGDYYAWGETEKKDLYAMNNYKFNQNTRSNDFDDMLLTKYCPHHWWTYYDKKEQLDTKDDVARVRWGGQWHMPSAYEMEELIHKCTWTWTKKKGIEGYKVTGPNGNSIFLPACGCRHDEISGEVEGFAEVDYTLGYYWTDELADGMEGGVVYGKDGLRAAMLFLDNSYNTITISDAWRFVGACVRPVFGYLTTPDLKCTYLHGPVESVKETVQGSYDKHNCVYQFDEQGNLLTVAYGNSRRRIERDEKGRIAGAGRSGGFAYDEDGWLVEEYVDGVESSNHMQYTNNEQGWPLSATSQCMGDCGDEIIQYSYSYPNIDRMGNWTKQRIRITEEDGTKREATVTRTINYWNNVPE